jgi:hypothetical protein
MVVFVRQAVANERSFGRLPGYGYCIRSLFLPASLGQAKRRSQSNSQRAARPANCRNENEFGEIGIDHELVIMRRRNSSR